MSTFALKITALILMFLDHTGLYFEGAPVWFRWLGRASYPLFLFSMVWGYHYTRNRKKYLLRLYLMSIFMTGFMYFIKIRFNAVVDYGYHNIFLSMLLVGVLISTIELFIKDRKKGGILIGVIVLVQILYYMLPRFFPFLRSLSGDTLTGVIPNLAMNEYGLEFVALGVLMYFLKEQKDVFTAVYLIFCICQFSEEMLAAGTATQWLMVLALPFMLSYNNQKGPGLKYFFYVFYPAHTFLLFYAANYIFSK
ncbi:MAG: TraX family protein [Hungatella hathewayi]|uniref:TraX family protein n=1 Tax=Hungatella TaxID=1649459 RepID=UPI00110634B7|nr:MULTISPECIES: TraX family protein [Hungatella]MCI7384799.1 conjugal transfer protein TraX [Hungatella sp.]MDY6239044.1 TraX family protein [Hungatella hathewayi]